MVKVQCDKELCSKNECSYTQKYTCCFDCSNIEACQKEDSVCDYIDCGASKITCKYRVKE